MDQKSDFTFYLLQDCLRILARLAYEEVDCLYQILNEIESKSGIKDFKYLLLTKFYDMVKVKFETYFTKRTRPYTQATMKRSISHSTRFPSSATLSKSSKAMKGSISTRSTWEKNC